MNTLPRFAVPVLVLALCTCAHGEPPRAANVVPPDSSARLQQTNAVPVYAKDKDVTVSFLRSIEEKCGAAGLQVSRRMPSKEHSSNRYDQALETDLSVAFEGSLESISRFLAEMAGVAHIGLSQFALEPRQPGVYRGTMILTCSFRREGDQAEATPESAVPVASESRETPKPVLPPAPLPAPPPASTATTNVVSFAQGIRLAALLKTETGVTAGFTRQHGNDQVPFILRAGETIDGLELVQADAEKGEAVLKKESETVKLELVGAPPEPPRLPPPAQPIPVRRQMPFRR